MVALVLGGVLAACTSGPAATTLDLPGVRRGLELQAPGARDAAPTERVRLVTDEDRQLGVPDFTGQVLVVNFWASWCAPCRTEQPELNAAHDELAGADVAFLGVNIQDSVANATAHLEEFDVPYPSLYDRSNAYAARYRGVGPKAIPTTIIIDREGRVATRLFGETDAAELRAIVDHLLDETPPGS